MPPVHNLPLGFAMDPKKAKTGKDIKEALLAFFGIKGEDITYDFLLAPYTNNWCKMMSTDPDQFAQTVVSLKQVKTSWLMITQPQDATNVSHAHQATYAHMECMLLHRIFRDGMIAGATANYWAKLQSHEAIIKMIFEKPECDEDEDQHPPLGNLEIAMQAYAYYLVGPAAKAWDTKRGFAELRGALPAPNLAKRFQYLTNPPLTRKDVTEETRLHQKVLIEKNTPNNPTTTDLTGITVNIQKSVGDKTREEMFSFLQGYNHQDDNTAGSPLTIKAGPGTTEKNNNKNKKTRAVQSDSSTDSNNDSDDEEYVTPKKKKSKNTHTKDDSAEEPKKAAEKKSEGMDQESAELQCLGTIPRKDRGSSSSTPSPFKPSIHTNGDILKQDQWKTPAALQANLQHYVLGKQALKVQILVAETGEDEREDYFTSARMLERKINQRTVKVTAHLLAHCLPDSAATKLIPRVAPTKRMHISFLMHPGNIGGE